MEANTDNIDNALHELQNFAHYSGLTINYDKTTAFILGPLKDTDAKFYTMKKLFWSDGPVKILGIMIHPDINTLCIENYQKTLNKVKEILAMWNHRSLTLQGKIVVVNNLTASLFNHLFMSLPSPKTEFFFEYKRIIKEFLWEGKRARI